MHFFKPSQSACEPCNRWFRSWIFVKVTLYFKSYKHFYLMGMDVLVEKRVGVCYLWLSDAFPSLILSLLFSTLDLLLMLYEHLAVALIL